MGRDTFGEFVRNLRLQQKLTLREFCREHDLEPANWSRMERGVTAPPQDRSILERYARYLAIRPETEDWRRFMDLAAIDSGIIPEDIMTDDVLLERVPVLFRAARGDKLTREQLDELLGLLRKETKNVRKKTT
jgi:transcriptional regulator with XRE-family HTH domain